MELNNFLFPAPRSSYTLNSLVGAKLIYIPKSQVELKEVEENFLLAFESRPNDALTTRLELDKKNGIGKKKSHSIFDGSPQIMTEVDAYVLRSEKYVEEEKHIPSRNISKLSKMDDELSQMINSKEGVIPCMFLPCSQKSSKVMLYFHGNGEDVGLAKELLEYMSSIIRVHIIAIEYPGYGIYQGKPDASQILIDADIIFNFVNKVMGILEEDVIIFGRSIGSGPATYIASKYRVCALVLLAPFKSIRDAAKETAGNLLKFVISDRFRNIDLIEKVISPTFIVHGQKDKLVPLRQAQDLHMMCGGPCAIISPPEMDHNNFDFIDDLITPLNSFLRQCKISMDDYQLDLKFPKELYTAPLSLSQRGDIRINRGSFWNWFMRTCSSSSQSAAISSSSVSAASKPKK